MLKSLRVSNLAVVESATVEFGAALNVITGETGAGKSVLMGALDLALGGRTDASVVRDGAKEAAVEAELGEHTVRRTITAEGRSRAWIDDESVTIAELRDFGARLVDVHGPTANQRLLEESFQRGTLGTIPKNYAAAWSEYSQISGELAKLTTAAGGEDELDLLRYQVNELESAALSDEDETLSERHAAAAHAEEILENANFVTDALGGDHGAAEALIALQPKLKAMARHFPLAEEWAVKADELTLGVQDLSRAVAEAVSRLDNGEENLDELDNRLTLVNKLKRKYLKGEGTVAALLEVAAKKRERLDFLEHADERRAKLNEQLAVAEAKVRQEGAKLTKSRKQVAEKLGAQVTRELKDLGFREAKFYVEVEAAEPAAHGCDRVVFMFAPNPGESARPLAAIASSGEIARVMLALKVVVGTDVDTLVFDEIDANIGGEIGKVTGEKLRQVAKGRQVIAITHLPQSAVFGDRHFVVEKAVRAGRTRTSVVQVEGEARVHEIARMLGGEKLTSVARKHAEELLNLPTPLRKVGSF